MKPAQYDRPEWAASVALIRASEELDGLQHKLWDALGALTQWPEHHAHAFRAMSKAIKELQEAALLSMPPGGTSDDYADIVDAIRGEGAAT